MRKIVILCLFVLLINGVYALSIDIKDIYAPGENILGEISGNVLEPITKGQIEIKRANVLMPLDGDIKSLGGREFFWAMAPKLENNYTLYINNITTNVAGEVKKVDLIKNFSVVGNLTDYSISPGFIFTTENFSLKVFLYEDFKREIDVSFPYVRNVTLNPGENELSFQTDELMGENFITIKIGKYSLPAYIIGKKTDSINGGYLEFRPIKIQRTILLSDRPVYVVEIVNMGNSTISDLRIYHDDSFYITPENILNVEPNQSVSINVSLRNMTNESLNKNIYAVAYNINVSLPITINVTSNATMTGINKTNQKTNYYCAELNGIICSASETCSATSVVSLDGTCCTGKCQIQQASSSSAWIGYLLGLLVLVGFGYLVFRYKKKAPGGKEMFDRKVAEAQKKMP